jgi:hypothetical protein
LPLGSIAALHEWAARDDPGYPLCIEVTIWIATELGSRGWAAPSVPLLPRDGETTDIRSVAIPSTEVTAVYEHDFETGRVDLFWVGFTDS